MVCRNYFNRGSQVHTSQYSEIDTHTVHVILLHYHYLSVYTVTKASTQHSENTTNYLIQLTNYKSIVRNMLDIDLQTTYYVRDQCRVPIPVLSVLILLSLSM